MSQARSLSAETPVDALVLAARDCQLQQTFAFADLPRISEQMGCEAAVKLRARFCKIDNRVMVEGEVSATLRLCCQRCLQPVDVAVEDVFSLVIVPSDAELNELSEAQDAIVADPSRLNLAWLTEEQLLLATPLVPMHVSDAECGVAMAAMAETLATDESIDVANVSVLEETAIDANIDTKTQRPFAALRELMGKN